MAVATKIGSVPARAANAKQVSKARFWNPFVPWYCGLSICKSGNPAIGRITNRLSATSITPGDTMRSTPIGSSSQMSLRSPWTPKSPVPAIATVSAPQSRIACSAYEAPPTIGSRGC